MTTAGHATDTLVVRRHVDLCRMQSCMCCAWSCSFPPDAVVDQAPDTHDPAPGL